MFSTRSRAPGPRHIAILNWRDAWHPEGGGSEAYVRHVAEHLAALGIRVTVVTARYRSSSRREQIAGVDYVRRGGHLSVYLWAAVVLLTRRLGRVDEVLEVQNGMPFLATWCTRKPVVVLVHHVHREQWPVVGPLLARVGWFMESRVAVRANAGNQYVAVSEVTRSELVDLGVDASAITVAYNGMTPAPPFAPLPQVDGPVLATLSRLVPHKRIEHAIRLLPALAEEFPGVRLHVIGSGWWSENLERATAELGVSDRVVFFGHVAEEAKFALLSQAHLHLLPSLKEGWGLSIIEAALVAVPSVAYRSAGGVQESILDGVTGLLANDEADLLEVTRRLLRDPGLRADLASKAALRATSQFTWASTTATVDIALGVR
ncbi:MAG: glycosyltransferase family 4 protein [Nocardioides sp.]